MISDETTFSGGGEHVFSGAASASLEAPHVDTLWRCTKSCSFFFFLLFYCLFWVLTLEVYNEKHSSHVSLSLSLTRTHFDTHTEVDLENLL